MMLKCIEQGCRRWILVPLLLVMSVPVCAENPFKASNLDRGKLTLEFKQPKKSVYRDIRIIFEHSERFNNIVKLMNAEFIFPENVSAVFADDDGPMYLPAKKEIVMSYSFIFFLSSLYLDQYKNASDDDMIDFTLRTSMFLFYHEIAHAMIDIYELPIVSNEETAADNLAVILALEYNDDGFSVIMDSAELFNLLDHSAPKKRNEKDYWDEHTLDAQRFYNILCLAYGVYPDKVNKAVSEVKNKKLMEFVKERGESCRNLYDQQLTAWAKLLKPYFRNL